MIHLLLIEDDKPLNESICFFFAEEGFAADGALCAEEAFRLMERKRYDIVITDVMLPQTDGFEVARLLRVFDPNLPIIFLTALDDIRSKEKGYDIGIDDYLTKPVELSELKWHVQALLRRAGVSRRQSLTAGNLTMDEAAHSARCGGQELPLTLREFRILYHLLSHAGETFTRGRLMERFWDGTSESTLRAVDVYITKLREKTKDCDGFEIVTVRGLGYKAVLRGEERA
ncbi:MAG: response regulator transcription factor [Clostridia bacterium]|nr:response regulator transcription factor [Clostridia bacterium]